MLRKSIVLALFSILFSNSAALSRCILREEIPEKGTLFLVEGRKHRPLYLNCNRPRNPFSGAFEELEWKGLRWLYIYPGEVIEINYFYPPPNSGLGVWIGPSCDKTERGYLPMSVVTAQVCVFSELEGSAINCTSYDGFGLSIRLANYGSNKPHHFKHFSQIICEDEPDEPDDDPPDKECPDLNLTIRGTLLPARRGTARISGSWCR